MTTGTTINVELSARDYERLSGLAVLVQSPPADVAARLLRVALEQIAKGALRIDGGM